ncbi:hypothetical protein C8J56DRAFT_1057864 [Mycena floridula]|nr:hypothetical protein C8J56DRAFT_1057864 [Mycena floridula]
MFSDDEFDEYLNISSSPIRATKHNLDAFGADDDEATQPARASASLTNSNIITSLQRSSESKRMRPEQQLVLETFLNDTPAMREAKLYVKMLNLQGAYAKMKNITSVAAATLLSSKLHTYKGKDAEGIVMSVILKNCYGLPPNFEQNRADLRKVEAAAQNALTQHRAGIKKLPRKSLTGSNKSDAPILPDNEHWTVYCLTKAIIENTQYDISVALAVHVALMRRTYIKDSSPRFWDSLDKNLAHIWEKGLEYADKNGKTFAKSIAKLFEGTLQKDCDTHGVKNVDEEKDASGQVGTSFQDSIDAVIENKSFRGTPSPALDDKDAASELSSVGTVEILTAESSTLTVTESH